MGLIQRGSPSGCASLNPARLLQEIRLAQQTLSDLVAHGVSEEVVAGTPAIADCVASLASAWKDGEARPTHRRHLRPHAHSLRSLKNQKGTRNDNNPTGNIPS